MLLETTDNTCLDAHAENCHETLLFYKPCWLKFTIVTRFITTRVGTKMAYISLAQQKRFLRDTSPSEPFADQEFAFKIMLSVTQKTNVIWQRFDTKISFCLVVYK